LFWQVVKWWVGSADRLQYPAAHASCVTLVPPIQRLLSCGTQLPVLTQPQPSLLHAWFCVPGRLQVAVHAWLRVSPGAQTLQPPPALLPPQLVEHMLVSAAAAVFCQVVLGNVVRLPHTGAVTETHTWLCVALPHWPDGQLTVVLRVAPTWQVQPLAGAHAQRAVQVAVAVVFCAGHAALPALSRAPQGIVCTSPAGQTPWPVHGPGTQKHPSQVLAWVPHQPQAPDCVVSWVHTGDMAAQAAVCCQVQLPSHSHFEPTQVTAVPLPQFAPVQVSQRRVSVVPGVQPAPLRQLFVGGHKLQVPINQLWSSAQISRRWVPQAHAVVRVAPGRHGTHTRAPATQSLMPAPKVPWQTVPTSCVSAKAVHCLLPWPPPPAPATGSVLFAAVAAVVLPSASVFALVAVEAICPLQPMPSHKTSNTKAQGERFVTGKII
jgi:hypothetical protein